MLPTTDCTTTHGDTMGREDPSGHGRQCQDDVLSSLGLHNAKGRP